MSPTPHTSHKSPNRMPTKTKTVPDKRPLRYRSSCPAKLKERMDRAQGQPLYIVNRGAIIDSTCDLIVMGSTGNVYTVTLGQIPRCNCPDYSKRADLCKHLLFCTTKVLGFDPSTNPLAYQRAYTKAELEEVFAVLNRRRCASSIVANERVLREFAALATHGEEEETVSVKDEQEPECEADDDCPICFDSLVNCDTEGCSTCVCRVHTKCMRLYQANTLAPTCPLCRTAWPQAAQQVVEVAAPQPGFTFNEGYINMGELQGQPLERDTSTYSDYYGIYGGGGGRYASGGRNRRSYNRWY